MCLSCCCLFWQYGRVALLCSRLKFCWVYCLSSNKSWFNTQDISIGYCFVRKFFFVCVYTSDDSIEMFGEKVTPSLWQRANAWSFSLFNSLLWQIYDLNYVVNTNLPAILSHQYSTTVSLKTYSLYSFYFGLDRLYNSQHGHLTYLGYYISFLPFHDISMDVFKQK